MSVFILYSSIPRVILKYLHFILQTEQSSSYNYFLNVSQSIVRKECHILVWYVKAIEIYKHSEISKLHKTFCNWN